MTMSHLYNVVEQLNANFAVNIITKNKRK